MYSTRKADSFMGWDKPRRRSRLLHMKTGISCQKTES